MNLDWIFGAPEGTRIEALVSQGGNDPVAVTVDLSSARPRRLVSCIMVSRGGLDPARQAIDCYRAQTYDERELVICSERPSQALADWIAALDDPTIRLIEAPAHRTLGELRNFAVDCARGLLISIWDDDDLYDSARLEIGCALLEQHELDASFLLSLILWWPERRRLAFGAGRCWEGSMIVRRDALPAYPAEDRHEDNAVMRQLIERGKTGAAMWPAAYVYRVTGTNTSPSSHFELLFSDGLAVADTEYESMLARLKTRIPCLA